jgi:hypothetical protein
MAASATTVPQPPASQPPVILGFAINDSAATVTKSANALILSHVLAGTTPVAYRVGVRADFANALWLPYTTPLRVSGWQGLVQDGAACDGRVAGQRLQLFFQVRAEIGGTVRIVNGQRTDVPSKVESNVVSDAICVVPERR